MPQQKTSKRSLKILAALIWYAGGIVLALKCGSLLLEADALRPQQEWHWFSVLAGLILGAARARLLFSRSIKKNLRRIDALDRPRVFLCFRPTFFFFLTAMIATGTTLSRLAHGDYVFLICVATLDLSIATALLTSGPVFWRERAFTKQ
ncbi:MAG: hypothetical protein WBC63_01200 [Candidatus Bipolaricaulia bacterium]